MTPISLHLWMTFPPWSYTYSTSHQTRQWMRPTSPYISRPMLPLKMSFTPRASSPSSRHCRSRKTITWWCSTTNFPMFPHTIPMTPLEYFQSNPRRTASLSAPQHPNNTPLHRCTDWPVWRFFPHPNTRWRGTSLLSMMMPSTEIYPSPSPLTCSGFSLATNWPWLTIVDFNMSQAALYTTNTLNPPPSIGSTTCKRAVIQSEVYAAPGLIAPLLCSNNPINLVNTLCLLCRHTNDLLCTIESIPFWFCLCCISQTNTSIGNFTPVLPYIFSDPAIIFCHRALRRCLLPWLVSTQPQHLPTASMARPAPVPPYISSTTPVNPPKLPIHPLPLILITPSPVAPSSSVSIWMHSFANITYTCHITEEA